MPVGWCEELRELGALYWAKTTFIVLNSRIFLRNTTQISSFGLEQFFFSHVDFLS